MIRFVLVSAWKDLRRRATDPVALVMWLGIPLLVGSLMGLVTGDPGQAPRGVVFLADEDDGVLGRVIEGSLQQGPVGSLFEVRRVEAPEGRARLQAGEGSALLIVPAGATEAYLTSSPVTLTLVKNPAQRILPGIVEQSLELLTEAGFYVQRMAGGPLSDLNAQLDDRDSDTPTTEQVASLAAAFSVSIRQVQPLLFPPVLDFSLEAPATPGTERPSANPMEAFGRLFVPGLIFMSLLFIAQGMSGDLWEEHRQGTLRRVLGTPSGAPAFLLGKVLAGTVLMTAVTAVALTTSIVLFDVAPVRALVALPWAALGGTVLVTLFLIPQVLAATQRGANMLGSLLVFPLMMVGGSFFPFEAMPAWMAAVGRWTPNGQAVARLKDLLDGNADPATFAMAGLALVVPGIASLLFATARLRRRFAGGT
jgi:ABC-type multidrug transport system permease subunit